VTSNYPPPPPPGQPGMGATTEQLGRPPGMGTVLGQQPPSADPLSVRRGPGRMRDSAPGWATSEFGVFVVAALGNLLASGLAGGRDGQADPFPADKAWFYITLLAAAYILSRGIAKAGGRSRGEF
jgi:hypothetical protein